jgi:NAD-dependent deacetylase sirtuin 4
VTDADTSSRAQPAPAQAISRAGREAVDALCELLALGPVAVLTGAGISTESGIPDYRGPETRRRARNPVQYRDFLRLHHARKRYWARSLLGWPKLAGARPSSPHLALARLEAHGAFSGVITQNVDSLHVAAGSRTLVELHGALREVICLQCGELGSRAELQVALERENPDFARTVVELGPDGDAELAEPLFERFRLVDCTVCGGPLKPHVVFFGENVPAQRVTRAFEITAAARSLWVLGSSLTVFSGLRFVRAATKQGMPVAIVNLGPTRGDEHARLRIDARAGLILDDLLAVLQLSA